MDNLEKNLFSIIYKKKRNIIQNDEKDNFLGVSTFYQFYLKHYFTNFVSTFVDTIVLPKIVV